MSSTLKEGSPVVMITGVSRGIGLHLVNQFLERKYVVVGTYRNMNKDLENLQSSSGQSLLLVQMEVSDDQSVKSAFESVKKAGVTKINILINNAGIIGTLHPKETMFNVTSDEMMAVFRTNCVAPLVISQIFLPLLQAASSASSVSKIIFISTMMSSIKNNTYGGSISYRTSKTALNMTCKTCAADYCQQYSKKEESKKSAKPLSVTDVTFNCVDPGWVQTDMGKQGGMTPPLTVEESGKALTETILKITVEENGKFLGLKGQSLEY